MDSTAKGFLEVGNDGKEIVINHPDLKPDENGVGHIVFSPALARNLARLLMKHAAVVAQDEPDRGRRHACCVDDDGLVSEMDQVIGEQLELINQLAGARLDAKRYRRLQILGVAPSGTKHLKEGTVLCFSNLDEYVDADIKLYPSRGEARPL